MANIPGEIVWQANDNTWFTNNAAEVYPAGITIYHVDGRYKFTDGITALSALSFLGGAQGVQSVTGSNVDNTDPNNPIVNAPTLQEVTDAGSTTTNNIASNGGFSALDVSDNAVVDVNDDGINVYNQAIDNVLLEVDRVNDTVKILGVDVATNGKGAAIASASVVDLGVDGNSLYHITGSTTITSFSNLPAGVKKTIVFDGSLIITASANIILPSNSSMVTGAGDNAIVIGEGSGVVRFLSFYKYDESYTNYTPSVTGYSVAPTVTAGDCRWKMLTKNTCHVIIWPTSTGTSNATTKTVTLPFTAAWAGGAGFGFQQATMGMYNNGAHVNGSVRTRVGGSNILACYPSIIGSSWNSASTQANTYIDFVYQIEI